MRNAIHAAPSAQSIEVECDLPEPPEKVWRALTVPEILAAWMMPNDISPEAGSRFTFDKPEAPIECEILEAEPEKLLRYSWRERAELGRDRSAAFDSTVTFVLARTASGGTHLRIVHDGFAAVRPAVAMAGGGCRLSLKAPEGAGETRPLPANTPVMLSRAA
jgi:uncharacterized protein YndB with AHSA1/START domain